MPPKKQQTFNAIESRVRRSFGDLVKETREFEALANQATATSQHKMDLQRLVDQVNELYTKLQDEIIKIGPAITEQELTACNAVVNELHDTIRTQSKTAVSYIRDFEVLEQQEEEQKAQVAAEAAAAAAEANAKREKKEDINFVFNKSLQPQHKPNGSFSMHELRSWITDFEAFFTKI